MLDSESLPEDGILAQKVRRFTVWLTVGFIIIANALFLIALWGSGLDLDKVFGDRDMFDPIKDICLRMGWYSPVGEKGPVRLCKEWINLSDSSGQVHKVDTNLEIYKDKDGKVYVNGQVPGDGRVIALLLFVVAIISAGMWLLRYLIARYRHRLLIDTKTS